MHNRRRFIKNSTITTAMISVGPNAILGANDRIRMGGIGTGDRGKDRLRTANRLGAEVVALCDVNQGMLDQASASFDGKPQRFTYHEELLEQKNIDALVIAVPDHWHHDIFIDAIQAGYDIYMEKPLSKTIAEGGEMVTAVNNSECIVQIGNHRRSGTHWHHAKQAIDDGAIGQIRWVRTWDCRHWADGDPYQKRGQNKTLFNPERIDWKRFLGNAPYHPYSSDRASAWRWFWDYAGGLLTDIGAHNIDIALWMGNGYDVRSVVSNGSVYHLDFWQTPDIVHTTIDCGTYCVDFSAQFTNGFDGYGHAIYGTEGTIIQEMRSPYVKLFEKGNVQEPKQQWKMNNEGDAHMQNFLDCVKSRKQPHSPIATANKVIAVCHHANQAYREKKRVEVK